MRTTISGSGSPRQYPQNKLSGEPYPASVAGFGCIGNQVYEKGTSVTTKTICAERSALRRDTSLVDLEMLERDARPLGNAEERIIGDPGGNPGFLVHELVDVPEERRAPGHDDAPFHDICRKLGRGVMEHLLDRLDDLAERFADRLGDFGGAHRHGPGKPGQEVSAFYVHHDILFERHRASDADFHLLRGAVADGEVIVFLDGIRDCLVKLVAGDLHGIRCDDEDRKSTRLNSSHSSIS